MQKIQRNYGIDGLRGVAILLVLGIHFFGFRADILDIPRGTASWIYRLFGHGYFGVNIFFVLSGYLIATTSVGARPQGIGVDLPRFYARRVTRIAPLLILTVLIGASFMVAWPWRDAPFHYTFAVPGAQFPAGFWVSLATFSFNWYRVFDAGPTAGWFGLHWDILWSLAVEEQFYLLFPWLVLLVRTVRRLRVVLLVTVAVSVVLRAVLLHNGAAGLTVLNNSVCCFDALAIGVLLSLQEPPTRRAAWVCGLTGAVMLLVAYVVGFELWLGLPVLAAAVATALLIQASRYPAGVRHAHWLRWTGLPELGRLSYGAYLLHPIAFWATTSLLILLGLNPLIGFLGAILATWIVARVSFDLFERPVKKVGRRILYAWIDSTRGRSPSVGPASNEARRAGAVVANPALSRPEA